MQSWRRKFVKEYPETSEVEEYPSRTGVQDNHGSSEQTTGFPEVYRTTLLPRGDTGKFLKSIIEKSKEYNKVIIDIKICLTEIQVLLEFFNKVAEFEVTKTIAPDSDNKDPWPTSWFLHLTLSMGFLFQLQQIPLEVWIVPQIEHLSLIRLEKGLTHLLSPLIALQKHLSYFQICDTSIQTLPDSIRYCTGITELYVMENRFRALPGAIINFPKLNELSRCSNFCFLLKWETVDLQLKEEAGDKNPHKVYNPLSLLDLSSLKALHSLFIRPHITRNILLLLPSQLLAHMAALFSKYRICSWCENLFPANRGYEVYHSREDFKGYKYVPFGDPTCSKNCTLKIEERNAKYHYVVSPTVTVYDVSLLPEKKSKIRKFFGFV